MRLLERSTHGSSLTAAGAAFLPQAQALLHSAQQAVSAAAAAAPQRAITIGYVEDLVITPVVRALRHRRPDVHVTTRHLDWNETSALPEHRVDVLVTRTPLPGPSHGLQLTVRYDEPRVVLVPYVRVGPLLVAGRAVVSRQRTGRFVNQIRVAAC